MAASSNEGIGRPAPVSASTGTSEAAPVDPVAVSVGASERRPRGRMIEVLRIGLGIVWFTNFFFIIYPPNNYFGEFSGIARSFAPVSFGGPGFPDYVASHPLFFSWLIALVTAYLAVAFTLGLTTRIACFVGSFFSAVLFAIQIGSIFVFPGGTDTGEHPLFILISGVLLVGGAGSSLSLDEWSRLAWARYRAAHPTVIRPTVPAGWTGALSTRTLFSYFIAGTLVSLAVGVGLIVAFPLQPASSGPPLVTGPTTYENLTVNIASNGWPQYTPANFTLHTGLVKFTIVDNDLPFNWSGCPCPVTGTVGDLEYVNGTPMHNVSSDNVAHSFNVPDLNLAVYSPGGNTTQFSVDISRTGEFVWFCVVPCGVGADPYSTPPMNVLGYMTGTITVV
ncbi:MAG: hypothetical protein ABSA63_02660 [Thermoplasmata archaeon]|jgi:uncharacterized membrane protein YphA (DoxX/SURF4 family)